MRSHGKKPVRSPERTPGQQPIILACAIARKQQHIALWLSSGFERLPLRVRKALLLVFCLLMGTASGWLLLQAARPASGLQAHPQQKAAPTLPPPCLAVPDTQAVHDLPYSPILKP